MTYNKIQVAFGALKKITGPSLQWQYNEKQILVITGLDLPEYYAVDFCNEGDADTITMTASAAGVEIPDQFLLTGKRLIAYIVVVDGEAVNTIGQITFPVNVRGRRTDISPEPAEQQQIDELVNLLNNAAVKAIPEGGLAGQVLSKKTDSDYDTEWVDQSGGGGGTTNYNRLTNKPQINGVELAGNKSTSDLNIDAGGISFDPEEDHDEGTVGAELSSQSNAIGQLEGQVVTDVTVTGTDVTIVAQANKRYLCGTVSTIAVTPCATGAFDLIFTSGSSAAILTIPSTVKWQDSSFDPTALDTDTTYEISVADGTLGLVAKWI